MKAYVIAKSIEELNTRLRRKQPTRVLLIFNEEIRDANIYDLAHKDVVYIYCANKDGSPKIVDWGHWHVKAKIVKRALWKDKPVRSS